MDGAAAPAPAVREKEGRDCDDKDEDGRDTGGEESGLGGGDTGLLEQEGGVLGGSAYVVIAASNGLVGVFLVPLKARTYIENAIDAT